MNKTVIWAIIILLIPTGIMTLCWLWAELIDHMFKTTPYNGTQTTIYKIDNNKKALIRKHPPCATFFSRVDGQERQVDGPYEEQWLTLTEKWNWKIRRNK